MVQHGVDERQDDFVGRLSKVSGSIGTHLDDVTPEEQMDTDHLLRIARHLLSRYENKREIYKYLAEMLVILQEIADSVDEVDDQMAETVLSARNAINDIMSAGERFVTEYSVDQKLVKKF